MNTALHDLPALLEACEELGLATHRRDANTVEVTLSKDRILTFQNWPEDNDSFVGFEGVDSHGHGSLILMVGEERWEYFGAAAVVRGLASGELCVDEILLENKFVDRWISHRNEPANIAEAPGEVARRWFLTDPRTGSETKDD